MDFSSVSDFIHKAINAKEPDRKAIENSLEEHLASDNTAGVPLELSETISDLIETYGDEALRQIILFCLAKWSSIHQEIAQDQFVSEDINALLLTTVDITKINRAMDEVAAISSFGGFDDWKTMIVETTSQAVLENIEEKGVSAEAWIQSLNG